MTMILKGWETNEVNPEPTIAPVYYLERVFRPWQRKGNPAFLQLSLANIPALE